jgi:hypothetical protein
MAQTAVDCCNSALQRVGAATITSLTDNSPEARACSVAYDSNRRDELRKHPWNFAITRVVLAPDATAPAFDFKYQFTLPSDCLRVLRSADYDLDWKIEGRKILSNNSSTLYLRYISDITDPTQWDSSFYNVVAGALAIDICEKLTQSNTKKQMLIQQYEGDVRMARRMNAFESGPEDAADDLWWIARL